MPEHRIHRGDELHVIPRGDFIFHDLGENCICGPDLEFAEDGMIYVHHSLDGREDTRVQRLRAEREIARAFDVPPWLVDPAYPKPRLSRLRWRLRRWMKP